MSDIEKMQERDFINTIISDLPLEHKKEIHNIITDFKRMMRCQYLSIETIGILVYNYKLLNNLLNKNNI